ncbi:MAG: cob(I)yrinic acid a,c-diamide adenosyltransferase [Planctomycetaceae bacterium]|nr:cob(I)yrinic acid a,c-diamide adenosyltransferase [Planctomycetaceae bacterium]
MSIYTRTGDNGTTSILSGERVSKASPEIDAGGSIDELSAFLGLVRAEKSREESLIFDIQKTLLIIGGELAKLSLWENNRLNSTAARITSEHVQRLEQEIDRVSSTLPPFHGFAIPGENRVSALLHVARTVCRRAERSLVRWDAIKQHEYATQNDVEPKPNSDSSPMIPPLILQYLNRLSDLLFVLACHTAP